MMSSLVLESVDRAYCVVGYEIRIHENLADDEANGSSNYVMGTRHCDNKKNPAYN